MLVPSVRFWWAAVQLTAAVIFCSSCHQLVDTTGSDSSYKTIPSWTNFKKPDETWAEFSTLEAANVHAMQLLCFETKLLNVILKTRPKQLLVSLP
jgi:hypothetical protein